MVDVKICGIRDMAMAEAAVAAGARYIGLVLVETSPRYIPVEPAIALARAIVALDAKPVFLVANHVPAPLLALGEEAKNFGLQLHGGEPVDMVAALRADTPFFLMKAFGVATSDDLAQIAPYAPHIDMALLDAKPPRGADRTGGHGAAFDWRLLAGWSPETVGLAADAWMLAGGLRPGNVAEAIALTGAPAVDVSSGVERAPGVKDVELMGELIHAAQQINA